MKYKVHILTIYLLLTPLFSSGQTDTSLHVYEGFYEMGFESSAFYELEGGNLYRAAWLEFDDSYNRKDSLGNVVMKQYFKNGVYIRFEGTKERGGSYGHIGGAKTLFIVYRILVADTSRTFDKFPLTYTDRYFHDSGRVTCEIIHLHRPDSKERHFIYYARNGQKTEEFYDRNGVVYDTLRKWTESGELHHMEIYSDTGYTSIDYWSETGGIYTIGNYKITHSPPEPITITDSSTSDIYTMETCDSPCYVRTGTWINYHKNGTIESYGQYLPMAFESSRPAGTWVQLGFETPRFVVVRGYLKDGLWIYYDENGVKVKEEFYRGGLIVKK